MLKHKKLGSIAFVVDERLSRERAAILNRSINALRQIAHVEVIPGDIRELDLVKKLELQTYQLVVVPWYRYLQWSKVEAFYGLTRNSGPTFAGYFCEGVLPYELGEQADHFRAILLDFSELATSELTDLIACLVQDIKRSGLRPLLEPSTQIYTENWQGNAGLGAKMDSIMAIPEILNTDWTKRANAIRIALCALWSLVYDEGPGKGELLQAIAGKSPRAYFQLGVDNSFLAMRLVFSAPNWTPKDALAAFWPDSKNATAPSQLLMKYSDFLRVHTVSDTTDVEIVVGYYKSAPSVNAHQNVHTLWVEPISANLIDEIPFMQPSAQARHLKPFPELSADGIAKPSVDPTATSREYKFILEAARKIRELKKVLITKDQLLQELRSGGVGTSQPLPPPDAESLLDAFQERYCDARFQIRQFELRIVELQKKGASEAELEALRLRIAALTSREQSWIKKIASTLEAYRDAKKTSSSDG